MARGNPAALSLGPGYLYIGPIGTTEPTDLVTPWQGFSANWLFLGYTDKGSEFDYTLSADSVNVAEELDPVSKTTTGRVSIVKFVLAELTGTNLMRALNAPTSALTPGAGIVNFEPPDLGTEVRRMIGFEAEDHTERWIYRQCFQTGSMTITRQKGAANATINCEFTLEKPASGAKLFKAIFNSPGRA